MRFTMKALALLIIATTMIGCAKTADSTAVFERASLDGEELASLLNMNCAKYTYRGPKKWCHWRISATHYGPDDSLVDRTDLGGGGCELATGSRFYCSIPVFDGGNAAVRFFGMSTNTEIGPLLPKRVTSSSYAWNSKVPVRDKVPIVLAVFAVDTKHSLASPNEKVPNGLGGNLVAITLEIKEAQPGSSVKWDEIG